MQKLRSLVVADPSVDASTQVVAETARLAEHRMVARSGEEAMRLVAEHKAEMLVLSLEINHPTAIDVVSALKKRGQGSFIVAVFRELAVPAMNRLARAGVDEFLPQPIDYTQLYRSAGARFGTPFRRHSRYNVSLELFRPDGVLVGRTLDISEGGLRFECIHPAEEDSSMLFEIALPSSRLRARCLMLEVEGAAPKKVTARAQFQNLRGEEHRRLIAYLAELARTMPEQD